MMKMSKPNFRLIMIMIIINCLCVVPMYAASISNHEYVDFSSDRSTWFFRTEGGNKDVVFCDFFSPFDPTVKTQVYDPLAMYTLDKPYYMDEENNLMISLGDLKKLYDPYFDYEIKDNNLYITYTFYDKEVIDGYGERATTLEYTKKVWELRLNIAENSALNSGVYNYTEYMPTTGGRNKPAIGTTQPNVEKSKTNEAFTFEKGAVVIKEDGIYVPVAELMSLMGKVAIEESGYLAIQTKDMKDVTVSVNRDEKVAEVVVPRASNPWHGGTVEAYDASYTWADYMNDVADGKRTTGWLWRAFYIPSGTDFKDSDGNEVTLEANRIVPMNIYVPTHYDPANSRLTYMLHGGTGNENTPTYRIMLRDVAVDQYAEDYNYVIVSPNGWTQNPMWREDQALYAFEKSFEMVMAEFPVDPSKVFITGNSMGGKGTVELAMRFPERFQAMAPTAMKIATKASNGGGTVINIEGTAYDLSAVENLPTLVIQGTADSTTSFKTQIGTKETPGAIVRGIMPKLHNATYITVEQGNHSYAYGSALQLIFEHFESVLKENSQEEKTLTLYKNSNMAKSNDEKVKLNFKTVWQDGNLMMALSDMQKLLGEDFNIYKIYSYDERPAKAVNYFTITYKNKSMNIMPNETVYRTDMQRYKEDANIIKSGAKSDEDLLASAPHFGVAPYEEGEELMVPVVEMLDALEITSSVNEKPMPVMLYIVGGIVVIGGLAVGIKLKRRKMK